METMNSVIGLGIEVTLAFLHSDTAQQVKGRCRRGQEPAPMVLLIRARFDWKQHTDSELIDIPKLNRYSSQIQ